MINYINGYDMKAKFNCEILNVTDVFMQFPGRKKSVDIDLDDTDGHDIDLFDPKFKDRPFVFKCVVTAPTITEFKEKYFGLWALLKRGGDYFMYNDHLDMMIYIYYEEQTNVSGMYRTADDGYGITFQLKFGERDPFANIPNVELVTDQYEVLVP